MDWLYNDVGFFFSDQQQDCNRDPALGRYQHARGRDWEVGGGGGHLPLSAQLQRSARDHVFSQPQLSLPTQEDMAQSLQAGIGPQTVNSSRVATFKGLPPTQRQFWPRIPLFNPVCSSIQTNKLEPDIRTWNRFWNQHSVVDLYANII